MTERVGLGSTLDMDSLTDELIDDIYAGAPAAYSEPGPESPLIEPPVLDIEPVLPVLSPTDERVILVNLRFTNEVIFMPGPGGEWTGEYVQFHDGRYLARPDELATILKAAPHVSVEPKEGLLNVHPVTKFATRNPVVWAQYCLDYANSI